MNNLLRQSQLFLKKNAPTILTYAGGVGVVATAIAVGKATPKALAALEQAKEEKGEKLTKLETFAVAGPVYIPAVLMGVGTLACIFGANSLNKRQQAALMSAYALLDTTHKEYKNKVAELYGTDGKELIQAELAKDKYEEEMSEDDGKELFFDEFSGRYFRSTTADVQAAEYRLNRDLTMRGYVYLNEWYEHLKMEPVDPGYALGWSEGGNMYHYWQEWIDFTHKKVPMDDGMECTIVTLLCEPIPDFMEYS